MSLVRPSSLPKLKQCRCFQGTEGESSPAAERGTRLDKLIRGAWESKDFLELDKLPQQGHGGDFEACKWALKMLAYYADYEDLDEKQRPKEAAEIITNENFLRAQSKMPELASGTMDAYCPDRQMIFDFKSGRRRDYKAQMAGYALAQMEKKKDKVTAILLFIDEQIAVSHRFSYTEAQEMVQGILDKRLVAKTCEYCNWCANFEMCPAVGLEASELYKEATKFNLLEALSKNEPAAWKFKQHLSTAKAIDERLSTNLRKSIKLNGASAFFTSSSQTRKKVDGAKLAGMISADAASAFLSTLDGIKLDEAKSWWEANFLEDLPAGVVTESAPFDVLRSKTAKQVENLDV